MRASQALHPRCRAAILVALGIEYSLGVPDLYTECPAGNGDLRNNAIARCPVLDAGQRRGPMNRPLGKSFSGGAGDARTSAWSRIAL